jgi:hypothetical protein
MSIFPLTVSGNGRYLVDANGHPFRIQGDSSWDIVHNAADLNAVKAYLDDRQSRGFNAILCYYNPVAYYSGSSAPWFNKLGGSGAGTAALPFTLNTGGTAWNGDPTFTNHDAAFSSPNDDAFEWLGQVIDECDARDMLVVYFMCYMGFNSGNHDGWAQTILNTSNTTTVCNTFGQYLANGHGTFSGYKNRKNILWIVGGDTLPGNGSTLALRALEVLKGLQTAGDTHLVSAHWQRDFLTPDQTDFASRITVWHSYTADPSYAEGRASYAQSPTRPVFTIELHYWGEHGLSRANVRYNQWGSQLSCVGGQFFGFGPFWGFATSADGTTTGTITDTTAWQASHAYTANFYVSHGGNWYRAKVAGTSAASGGPTGTGTNIVDNTVTWTFVATVSSGTGMTNLFGEPAVQDAQQVGYAINGVPWHLLVPESLGGTGTIVTAGQGTAATWSDGNPPSGGTNWIVSAAASDSSCIVCYVPDPHTGAFSIDMTRMSGRTHAFWIDPVNGTRTMIGSFPNTGTHSFTVPGTNSGGDKDWVLVLELPLILKDPIGYGVSG